MEGFSRSINRLYCPVKNQGFSLIEIAVAIAVLLIIAGLVIPGFNFFQKQSALETAAQEIIQTARLAQSKTLASENDSNFGVFFENNRFILFKGVAYPANPVDDEIHQLDSSLIISAINFNGAVQYAVFERLTGATTNYGSLVINQINNPTQSKTIYLNPSGAISLSADAANDDNRLKDSRHVEVLFSQSVKTAGVLTVNFSDDFVTGNVNFQGYLNADKTEFSWEDAIIVNGQTQKLKIHTHILTDTEALFCFHRDRQENTKAVNFALDGQNLINYSATGAITSGSSVWAGTAQIK